LWDYAVLEGAIAVTGVASLFILPRLGDFYALWGSPGMSDLPFRAVTALCVLCPPTILMGATLPAVPRGIAATPAGASRHGLFYGANTLGAVCGCLGAGLYLLRVFDVAVATTVAISLNILCAAMALLLSRTMPMPANTTMDVQTPQLQSSPALRWVMH